MRASEGAADEGALEDEASAKSDEIASSALVLLYRVAFLCVSLGWGIAYNLNFLANSGLQLDDGSLQATALAAADTAAGVAALLAPTGSSLLAAIVLRVLGLITLGSQVLGPSAMAGLAGPACVLVLCSREIFWFGLGYKLEALSTTVLFTVVLLLRWSAAFGGAVPLEQRAEFDPLSAWSALSAGVLATGKFFSPLAVDLEEDGELFSKESSPPLGGNDVVRPAGVPRGEGGALGNAPYTLSFVAALSISVLYVVYGLPVSQAQ